MSRKSRKTKQTVHGNNQNCSKAEMGKRSKKENINLKNSENENLGKQTKTIEASITNRIQEIKGRMSGVEDIVEEINHQWKKMSKNFLKQNIQ